MVQCATTDTVNLVDSRILPSRKPEPIPDTCDDLLLTLVVLAFTFQRIQVVPSVQISFVSAAA
jgi:hypothetical protein